MDLWDWLIVAFGSVTWIAIVVHIHVVQRERRRIELATKCPTLAQIINEARIKHREEVMEAVVEKYDQSRVRWWIRRVGNFVTILAIAGVVHALVDHQVTYAAVLALAAFVVLLILITFVQGVRDAVEQSR